ncbi:polymorphic toxin type 44 domain-containing protein [Vibrio quintilis]|uniref:polymorphic toxin type 44 domain-containing protein n=1 Tax=Vibrio quintilis TaxID=1117707 RepID=UPI00135639FA|nr:polymorphic toxin type 44 domain-containing protein [Vibrio quintilis]
MLKKEITSTPTQIHDPVTIKMPWQHKDGALLVADYILGEMKTNIQSETCKTIRYLLDYHQERLKEWQEFPWWKQFLIKPPTPDLLTAMALWTEKVFKGRDWDHKPLIRDNPHLKAVAVHRKLWSLDKIREYQQKKKPNDKPPTDSKSYWHKYKRHDYFYDIWSNVHYGYVGLACGFSQKLLLQGAGGAQFLDNMTTSGDAPDDVVSVQVGFKLYQQYGDSLAGLTPSVLMDTLEKAQFTNAARDIHLCFHPNKDELKNEN